MWDHISTSKLKQSRAHGSASKAQVTCASSRHENPLLESSSQHNLLELLNDCLTQQMNNRQLLYLVQGFSRTHLKMQVWERGAGHDLQTVKSNTTGTVDMADDYVATTVATSDIPVNVTSSSGVKEHICDRWQIKRTYREEGHGTTPRGADWEVVSLTASAYAAASGGTIPEFKLEEKGDHENVLSESENAEVFDHQVGKVDRSESVGGKVDTKKEENWAFKKLIETDFAENTTLSGINLSGKEQSVYGSSTLQSLHSEASIGALNLDDETSVLDESVQSSDSASVPNTPNLPKQTK
nr:ATG8-interacting protein 2-like [Tanacetum cinerariifolium]